MAPFSLFLALRYLRPKRSFISVVTLISVIGVLLGVAILIIVLSVFTGFGNMWQDKILSFKPHLTVYNTYGGPLHDVEDLCTRVEKVHGVTGVAPVVFARTLMQYEGRIVPPVVVGVTAGRADQVSRVAEHIKLGKFDVEGNNAVIGRDLALRLGVMVGDTALVHSPRTAMSQDEVYLPEEVEITGMFNMGMRDFDSEFVLTSIELVRDLVGLEDGAHCLYIMTDDPFRYDERLAAVRECLGEDYSVRTWRDEDQVLFSALRLEKTMMVILLIFISIVAIFCVTNTLIVITTQKTNEIGVLKALGFRSWEIMGVFVWHGWIQCLIGTLSGIGVAFLVLFNLTPIVDWLGRVRGEDLFPKDIYGLDRIPWDISAYEVTMVAVSVMAMCTLASFLPAYRAARLDPVRALRSE